MSQNFYSFAAMKPSPTISLYWRCQVIGWSMAAIYWGYAGYTGGVFDVPVALLHFFADVLICIAITHSFRWVSKKYGWQDLSFQKLLIRIVPSILLLSAVYTIVVLVKLYLMHSNFREEFTQSFSSYYQENSLGLYMGGMRLLCIWLLAYYLYHYAQQKIKIIQENARLSVIAKEAQLDNLSAQLNPHFLFNSLNSIKSLVVENPHESRRAIDLLSDLLRISLYERDSMLIAVKDELAIVNDYLELEKIRFEERLQVIIDVPPNLLAFQIIPFSIQILVENAVKHGINKRSEGGTISIKIGYERSFICMTVESPGVLNEKSVDHGLGLKNLHERLSLQFHDKASFNIAQQNSETVLATIMIPAA
jgi:sensor histidine kinase YesM